MKFFTAATTALLLSAQALAELTSYKLYAKSENTEVDGKGVSILHEGAGIYFVFLGTDSIDVTYDDVEKLLYVPVSSDIQFNFGTNADIVQFSVTLQFRLKLLKMDLSILKDLMTFSLRNTSMIHITIPRIHMQLSSEVNHMPFNQTCC